MTLADFRRDAEQAISIGAPYYGQMFIDLRDDTVYDVSRWVNAPSIAVDEYWAKGDPGYYQARRRAALRHDTIFIVEEAS